MPRKQRSCRPSVLPDLPPIAVAAVERDRAVGDILRVVTPYGERDSRTTRTLRDNCRKGNNAFAKSLDRLVSGDPVRARRLAGIIIARYAAITPEPLVLLNARETAEQGPFDQLQLAYQGGDRSGPILAGIVAECDDVIPLYQAMRESASQELAA